ncbi:MAG TPA: hypothetical protein DCM68_04335, partial [Verrucomicrobia bacterium]|nr:hypothetical protein [Verrucomicrobiota bacterium]
MYVGEFRSEYKRAARVRAKMGRVARGEEADAPAAYRVLLFSGDDLAGVARRIEGMTGAPATVAEGDRIRADLTAAQIEELTGWGEVHWVEPYTAPQLWNNISVRTNMMNVSNVWSVMGLTGNGQTIAVCDTGLDTGNTTTLHKDFTNRVTGYGWSNGVYNRRTSWADGDSHGTHVAGSVLGNGTMSTGLYKGVAYAANLLMQGVQADLNGIPADLSTLFKQAYDNKARIHSDSWGYDDHGYYNSDSRAVDQYVWSNKTMLILFSAGNSGTDANSDGIVDPDSVGSPGTAKNCLTVGAAENYRTGSSTYGVAWPADFPADPIFSDKISEPYDTYQGLAAFSSRGPCDDGRIKPDLVAPGTFIASTRSRASTNTGWGVVSANTNYLYNGGTSMATPLTAGAAALARQWVMTSGGVADPTAALLKALLLNGARNMAPGQYGTGAAQEIPATRPSGGQGWGHVDLYNTLKPAPTQTLDLYDTYSLGTGQTNTFTYVVQTGSTNKFILTMVYADYWGTAGSGKQLVNDLDLTVVKPSGTTNYANGRTSEDATNNVEMIEFAADEAGTYTVRVAGRNVPSGGTQSYALVVRGPKYNASASSRAGMGAIPYADAGGTGVTFRTWAPNASSVNVKGSWNSWGTAKDLYPDAGGGTWSVDLTNAAAGHEYKFYVNGAAKKDPRGYRVTSSAGNSIIYDQSAFDWGAETNFSRIWRNDLVIYEMHVGSYNAEDWLPSTFDECLEKIAHLKALGVSAVEVMPVNEFAGDRSWGYNPADPFAIESAFGGADGFKRFVRACHTNGIAVLVDVVHNHYGPSDLDLWRFDGWFQDVYGGIYFYNDWRAVTDWGNTRPDYGRP